MNLSGLLTFENPNDESFLVVFSLQLIRATNMIVSAMRFKLSLDETLLEPDIFHLKPHLSSSPWFKNVIRFVLCDFDSQKNCLLCLPTS